MSLLRWIGSSSFRGDEFAPFLIPIEFLGSLNFGSFCSAEADSLLVKLDSMLNLFLARYLCTLALALKHLIDGLTLIDCLNAVFRILRFLGKKRNRCCVMKIRGCLGTNFFLSDNYLRL